MKKKAWLLLLLRLCKALQYSAGVLSWVSGGAIFMMESSLMVEMTSENCNFVLCRPEGCEGD